ncbi:MAG TPA: pyridoxal-phosphate dependent enzyme, partial [Actinomycetota bacterium]
MPGTPWRPQRCSVISGHSLGSTAYTRTSGAGTDIDLALAKMREIVAEEPDRYYFPGEFENPDNVAAQTVSGEEIWEQLDGELDAVVGSQGTGGWITGVAGGG